MKRSDMRYHHGDLKAALIDATAELIGREGVEAVTMRRVSEMAGVSHAAPYRHFRDKAELLAATATEGFRRFGRKLREARDEASVDLLDRFRKMGHAYIRFAMENTAYYRLMFGREAMPRTAELQEADAAAFEELLSAVRELQSQGMIQREDPRLQAAFIWSLMHGLASLLIDGKLSACGYDMEELFRFVESRIFQALGADVPSCDH